MVDFLSNFVHIANILQEYFVLTLLVSDIFLLLKLIHSYLTFKCMYDHKGYGHVGQNSAFYVSGGLSTNKRPLISGNAHLLAQNNLEFPFMM